MIGSAGGGTVVGVREQLADALDRDAGLLVRVEHLRELLDRREEQVEVEQERDELADGERAVRDEHAARAEHDARRDVGEEVDEREVDRDEPLRVHACVAVAGGDLGEHLLVLVLAHERLRDAHAREALLEVGVDRRDPIARDAVRARRRGTEPDRRDDERRQDRRGDEAELRVEDREPDPDAEERHEVHERVHEAVLEQRRQRVDVGGHAGHDPARHLVLVVVDAEPLEVGEDLHPQRVQHAFGDAAHHARLGPHQVPVDRA